MTSKIATKYDVKFINHYEDFDPPLEITFTAQCPDSVKHIVEALSSHYSGDPYECFINGEKTVLEKDWGLV